MATVLFAVQRSDITDRALMLNSPGLGGLGALGQSADEVDNISDTAVKLDQLTKTTYQQGKHEDFLHSGETFVDVLREGQQIEALRGSKTNQSGKNNTCAEYDKDVTPSTAMTRM